MEWRVQREGRCDAANFLIENDFITCTVENACICTKRNESSMQTLMLTKCKNSHHFLQMSQDHINFLITDEIFATLETHVVWNHFFARECFY